MTATFIFANVAAMALTLKIFQLVISEPQDWSHRIMFVTAAVSLVVTLSRAVSWTA